MIAELLQRAEFKNNPPVLLDIGAAGDLPGTWKEIAPYSICIAFDGDEREFNYIEEKRKQFKKLVVVNKVVSVSGGEIDFYLTRSPQCSSTLKTETENLSNYAFADLFHVEKAIKLPSVLLSSVLAENKILYIDWFKTDTQGTDLRIIQSLEKSVINKVIIYELEPGIIDAYVGEDKLYTALEFFNKNKFIVLDAQIKGSYRINMNLIKNKLPDDIINNIPRFLYSTPDWCEVTFFNPFTSGSFAIREYLLGWIFATLKKQYGLALEIADKGYKKFNDIIFTRMSDNTLSDIKSNFKKQSAKKRFKGKLIGFLKKL